MAGKAADMIITRLEEAGSEGGGQGDPRRQGQQACRGEGKRLPDGTGRL